MGDLLLPVLHRSSPASRMPMELPAEDISPQYHTMEETKEIDQQLAEACAGTTICDIPDHLLMDVFEYFDAVTRLRKRM